MTNPPDAYEDQLPSPLPIPPVRTTGDKIRPLATATRIHLGAASRLVNSLHNESRTHHECEQLSLLTARLEDIKAKLSEMEALP